MHDHMLECSSADHALILVLLYHVTYLGAAQSAETVSRAPSKSVVKMEIIVAITYQNET